MDRDLLSRTLTGPYFLLLMLITPPVLALPIFWLWIPAYAGMTGHHRPSR